MTAAIVAHFHCTTGECPRWHTDEQRLYWTDIPAGRLFYYEPHTGVSQCCYEGRPVGGFTIQADGSLLLFRDGGNVVELRRDRSQRTIVESIEGLETTRYNDVIADPEGSVFAGTMSFGPGNNGKLLRFDRDGRHVLVSEGHGTPNGMGFSPDLSRFYFTDSRLRRIYLLDYDRTTGTVSNERTWQQMDPSQVHSQGRSDGMTVALDGTVWSARIEAGLVTRYSPEGVALQQFELGTPMVTSVTFGGPQMDELYVTSAGGKADDRADDPAGALFRIMAGTRGREEFRSQMKREI